MDIEVIRGNRVLSPTIANSFTALQIPPYWRAMEFLPSNLSSFPIEVHQNGAAIKSAHPLDKILRRKANDQMTSKRVLKTWYFHGEHYGNGYLFRRGDPITNAVIGLYNLMPSDVTPFRLVPENGSLFDAEIWYWHGPSNRPFANSDVLHYAPQISYDGLEAYNPSYMFIRTFARAQMLESFQTKFLKNGTLVRGSIELPAGVNKETAKEIVATMREFRASSSDRDVPVLFGGASLKNNTISPVDAQLADMEEANTKKISQITGVPQVHLMDSTDIRYNAAAVEAIGQDVVRFCFRPRLELLEAELTTKLLTEDEQDQGLSLVYDTSSLIRGDTAVEMAIATQGVAGGILTRNEGRTAVNEPTIDDPAADKLLVPSHVATESESPSQAESETHAADPSIDKYSAFMPLLNDAAARVEAKTIKALETATKKPEVERVIYTNTLAETQSAYAADALAPIAETILKISGEKIDVPQIAEKYAAEVRRRAAGQPVKELSTIMGEVINAA